MEIVKIAGKPSTVIGNQNTNLILKGQSVKIQWGNKFIDLIKDGKICSDSNSAISIKSANDIENLTEDGFYKVNDQLYIVSNKQIINLSSINECVFVSYNQNQDSNSEQKQNALKNIGFYCNTKDEISTGFTGLVYVLDEQKLYSVRQGLTSEYITKDTVGNNFEELFTNKLYSNNVIISELLKIYKKENSIILDCDNLDIGKYFKLDEKIIANTKVVLKDTLESENYSSTSGFKLYNSEDTSILEVGKVIERDSNDTGDMLFENIIYSEYDNIIKSVEYPIIRKEDEQSLGEIENECVRLYLKYSNKYKKDDYIYVHVALTYNVNLIQEKNKTLIELFTSFDNKEQVKYTLKCLYDDDTTKDVEITIPKTKSYGTCNVEYTGDTFARVINVTSINTDGAVLGETNLPPLIPIPGGIIFTDRFQIQGDKEIIKTVELTPEITPGTTKQINLQQEGVKKFKKEFKIEESGKNYIIIKKPDDIFSMENYKISLSRKPYIEQINNNITFYEPFEQKSDSGESKQILLTINKLGNVIENSIPELKQVQLTEDTLDKLVKEPYKAKSGIYSYNFIGLNSIMYNPIIKSVGVNKNDYKWYPNYPRYYDIKLPGKTEFDEIKKTRIRNSNDSVEVKDEKLKNLENKIVDEQFNDVIPNINWVKSMLDIFIPIGTIIMFDGRSSIPPGWAVCDGENGTPDLRGRFIKGAITDNNGKYKVSSIDNEALTKNDDGSINLDNMFKLNKDHLPNHTHPHSHSINTNTKNVVVNGANTTAVDITYYANESNTYRVKTYSESGDDIEDIKTFYVEPENTTYTIPHQHTITGTTEKNNAEMTDAINKEFRIEPHSYALIFIMKTQNFNTLKFEDIKIE